MPTILLIGATSAIAKACARQLANANNTLYLIARNTEELTYLQQDLLVRGAKHVYIAQLDVNDSDNIAPVITAAIHTLQTIDITLIAHAVLPVQRACEHDVALTLACLQTNSLSTIAMLTLLANQLMQQPTGSLAVITSIAGDRGRQSNYVYASSKAMLSVFLQGLRSRVYQHNPKLQILDIKPGFVDTPMTADFNKSFLWTTPEHIANDILHALGKRQTTTLYTPGFWRYLMWIIRHIPETIFKRLLL
jgi:decaprenylphospho-beta-D-erythro-pentofuranosid-2-ulose 2-reductase